MLPTFQPYLFVALSSHTFLALSFLGLNKVDMNRIIINKELSYLEGLCSNQDVVHIFQNVGCLLFFENFEYQAKKFPWNFLNPWRMILEFEAWELLYKELIFRETSFPIKGEIWYKFRIIYRETMEYFFLENEETKYLVRGVLFTSLPYPWLDIVIIVQKYVTYKGRYNDLYGYDFKLISHLWHARHINIPFIDKFSKKYGWWSWKGIFKTPSTFWSYQDGGRRIYVAY